MGACLIVAVGLCYMIKPYLRTHVRGVHELRLTFTSNGLSRLYFKCSRLLMETFNLLVIKERLCRFLQTVAIM